MIDAFKVYRRIIDKENLPHRKVHFYNIIDRHRSEADGITQEKLGDRLGVSPATIRKWIGEFRDIGITICTGDKGCWLSDDPVEIAKTIHHLRSRAAVMDRRADRLDTTLHSMIGMSACQVLAQETLNL